MFRNALSFKNTFLMGKMPWQAVGGSAPWSITEFRCYDQGAHGGGKKKREKRLRTCEVVYLARPVYGVVRPSARTANQTPGSAKNRPVRCSTTS